MSADFGLLIISIFGLVIGILWIEVILMTLGLRLWDYINEWRRQHQ
jgi:hypothetical protein